MHACIGKAVVGIGIVGMAVGGVVGCTGGTTTHHTKAECKAAVTTVFQGYIAEEAAGQDISNKPEIQPEECKGLDDATLKSIGNEVLSENADAMWTAAIANAFSTTP
jgi:hypothetical protein